jgi:hypothetical protein
MILNTDVSFSIYFHWENLIKMMLVKTQLTEQTTSILANASFNALIWWNHVPEEILL